MISKSFIALALSALALTSSVNAAAIPPSARQASQDVSAALKVPTIKLPPIKLPQVASLVKPLATPLINGIVSDFLHPAAPPATSAAAPPATSAAAPPATSAAAVSARSAPTDVVFARQDVSAAALKLPKFPSIINKLPSVVEPVIQNLLPDLLGGATSAAVSARSAPTDVFARQEVSADLKLPSLPKLPKLPDVGPLVGGFLSGLEAATPAAPPAASTTAVSARSAPTDVFARQEVSADLKLPNFKVPPAVTGLVGGAASIGANSFASVVGVQAASQLFAPAATTSA